MKRVILTVLFAFIALGILCLLTRMEPSVSSSQLYLQNLNFPIRVALFHGSRTAHADIVMLGNSLTEWVDWNELLGRAGIANRGIAGDITYGYLQRMEYIHNLSPKICFVEGGINDLYSNIPVDEVYENWVTIVEQLRRGNITPVITSVLYTSTKWHSAHEKNKEVAELNARLERFALANGIDFLNLIPLMTTNTLLRDELTYDGLHLTEAGYRIWGDEVEKALRKYGL